jgi:serine/threonine-protein kinase
MGNTDGLGAGGRIGDYVIDHELAARPGLVAWSATHALLPRRARLSTVHPAFVGSHAIAAELTREACILEVLRHAGVPRVFECGALPDQRPWVASELIEGPSLTLLLAEEGKLDVPMVLALLAGVAEILHHAHTRGLVHRNLRPDAIASRPEGPCVVDWSDARGRDGEAQQLVPSDRLAYQPPEVVAGRPADSRADVFALGVVSYESLIGTRPTPGRMRRPPAVPARLIALLERMMAPDALVRPTSAEVRAEALAIVEQIEIPGPPADEDGIDVQIEEVELRADEVEPDAEPPPPQRPQPAGSLAFTRSEADDRARTKTMPPEVSVDQARTATEPMTAEHLARTTTEPMTLEHLARTRTEPLAPEHVARARTDPPPPEPEPRLSRTSTRIVKLAPPPRDLESRTKTP